MKVYLGAGAQERLYKTLSKYLVVVNKQLILNSGQIGSIIEMKQAYV